MKCLILKLSAKVYGPLSLISPFTVKAGLILQDLSKVKDLNPWQICWTLVWLASQIVSTSRNGLRFPLSSILIFKKDTNPCLLNAYVCITESVTDETAREVNGGKRVVAVSLVTSKAWLSPLRTESISKLELAACVIAVRIRNWVAQAYSLNPKNVCCLTDLTNCQFWSLGLDAWWKSLLLIMMAKFKMKLVSCPHWSHSSWHSH